MMIRTIVLVLHFDSVPFSKCLPAVKNTFATCLLPYCTFLSRRVESTPGSCGSPILKTCFKTLFCFTFLFWCCSGDSCLLFSGYVLFDLIYSVD